MIRELWSDWPGFKRVKFNPHFNVITAERTKGSSSKDSRNGLGKSSVIAITRYLLGLGGLSAAKDTPLAEWTFYLSLNLHGEEITVARSPKRPGTVLIVSGRLAKWEDLGFEFQSSGGLRSIDSKSWAALLGAVSFLLPTIREEYAPSFGSLMSYFMRFGKDAFNDPFYHDSKQYEWDKQVNNAYLIGLNWRDVQQFQILRDKENAIKELQSLSDLGIMRDFIGARAELEAERGRIARNLETMREQLSTFHVAPQYTSIEESADELTSQINLLSNDNYSFRLLLSDYEEAQSADQQASYMDVETIYEEAGAAFDASFRRRLDDVRAFHERLIENRRKYLGSEINRLRAMIAGNERQISELDSRRAQLLRTLEANRALEQYTLLRGGLDEGQTRLALVDARLVAVNQVESARAQLRIESELLHETLVRHYNERRAFVDNVARLFNHASEHLYAAPGDLVIVPGKRGYRYSYKIERKGSEGIGSAAIFCYDLALAQIWAERSSEVVIAHDSTLFDPIDERQLAHALELAEQRSRELGFQYICSLNTDRIPKGEFTEGFSIDNYTVLRLTDLTEDGGLFGIRF